MTEFKVNDLIEWKECPGILGDFRYGRIRAISTDGTMQLGFVRGIVYPKDCRLLEAGSPEYEKANKFWSVYQPYANHQPNRMESRRKIPPRR